MQRLGIEMFDEFLRKSDELRRADEPFVMALVVRSTPPVSGKPGDKAIIQRDGSLWGWIGGGCAQPVVIKESLKAIQDGKPRLVRISPDGSLEKLDQPSEDVKDYTMTCHSGGALDIFIEPVLPKPHVVVFGRSLVAQALARLAKDIHYTVTVIAPGASKENFSAADSIRQEIDLAGITVGQNTFVVVSTQGENDEESLDLAVRSEAAYVGFVASRTKAGKVFEYLESKGAARERLAQVRAPAGLEIGAASPEEIAVSILAEIVEARATTGASTELPRAESNPVDGAGDRAVPLSVVIESTDPVCGMTVDSLRARHKSEFESTAIWFCCERCKVEFDRDPAAYVARTM
ncbi:MAG TPA: XdhC family protein [Blastocatellia bacterium]